MRWAVSPFFFTNNINEMSQSEILIKDLIESKVESMGFFLVDLKFIHGQNKSVRVLVDKKNKGITVNECALINKEIQKHIINIHQGGGPVAIQKQHDKQRMTCRERLKYLIDSSNDFFEIGTFAAYGMYEEYGNIASGGVITGIGKIKNRQCMIIANDATVKAGAYFEITLKKTLRAQQIANGAHPRIKVPKYVSDVETIAEIELKERKTPFIIKRDLPSGKIEYWKLIDMIY